MDDEKLIIGGKHFKSRLFVGTGKYDSMEAMAASIAAAETEMVTVAMRRVNLTDPDQPPGQPQRTREEPTESPGFQRLSFSAEHRRGQDRGGGHSHGQTWPCRQ